MKIKKMIYIAATIFLGLLLSFIVHACIEMLYINKLIMQQTIFSTGTSGNCYLPKYLRIGLPILGIIGGYFLGQTWWRIVYIEKRHWRFKKRYLILFTKITKILLLALLILPAVL